MKIEKFPVIAPDGTEYRVTITEDYDHWFGWNYTVTLYTERKGRKWFRFKSVFEVTYKTDKNGGRASGDWLITAAEESVSDYHAKLDRKRKETEGTAAALEAFRKWDGKISEAKPEVSE